MPNLSVYQHGATSGIYPDSSPFSSVVHRALASPSHTGHNTVADPRSFNLEDTLEHSSTRAVWILAVILTSASAACCAQKPAQPAAQNAATEDPGRLVRETVYNELQDHGNHAYWRYWIQQQGESGSRIQEQVETADGAVSRLLLQNGQPLDEEHEEVERARLLSLRNSPSEQASRRQAYREDEQRIGRILALLPDAFVYQDAGIENGARHLRYTPNPKYSAHTIEARVFHQLCGDLWIDVRMKRLRRLEGRLNDDVTFGLGMLGKVNKGSWYRMSRVQVSQNEWKTDRYEIHMNGRALLFKTIAHETSETRGGFELVPPAMTFDQGLKVLEQTVAAHQAAMAEGRISPAALVAEKSHPSTR
jgi:hypothetical protein